MERYDIAIIGTGPAGLEAAITAKVRNKKIILIGTKNLSSKVEKAHTIKNYLGLPEISGQDMKAMFQNHLEKMGIEITQDQVNAVYSLGDYFAIQGREQMYEASSVIVACGMSAAKNIKGEVENLGRGVSYCATCDALLYRNKSAIVIGYSENEEKEAEFLAEVASKVYYLPMYSKEVSLKDGIEIIKEAELVEIQKCDNIMQLHTKDCILEADGIFVLRENIAPSQLVPGLLIENNQVKVDRDMKTNIDGLFACGDITGAPYQYIKAAGEGNVAALSAVNYLAAKSKMG